MVKLSINTRPQVTNDVMNRLFGSSKVFFECAIKIKIIFVIFSFCCFYFIKLNKLVISYFSFDHS